MRDLDAPDGVLLGWLLLWSVVFTIAIVGAHESIPRSEAPEVMQLVLGSAMGGLAAVWVVAGTWAGLIDLPQQNAPRGNANSLDAEGARPQRWQPRVWVCFAWSLNVALLGVLFRHEFNLVAQLILISAIAIAGPLSIRQYTRRRIHRGVTTREGQQSIRQILGIVFTVAMASAVSKLANRYFEFSSATTALVLSIAILWIVMLILMLGRGWWRWLLFLTLPLLAVDWLVIASIVDLRSPDADAQLKQMGSLLLSFYCFSLLLLVLMRTSCHRWLD